MSLPTDTNGIALVQPLLSLGYRLTYSDDDYTFTKNFRPDGSMRCDFKGLPTRPSCMLAGYFKCASDSPDGEEISPKMNGGPHNDTNPTWADTMDIGAINMLGNDSRLRCEATHPNYGPERASTFDELPIGDIRNVWRGIIALKLNIDTNGDGNPDRLCLLAMIDIGGLDGSNAPVNNWKVTYRRFFNETELTDSAQYSPPLKSVWVPYVTTIGQSTEQYQTLRIDNQGSQQANWESENPAVQPYKYVTLKTVTVSKVRDVCEAI